MLRCRVDTLDINTIIRANGDWRQHQIPLDAIQKFERINVFSEVIIARPGINLKCQRSQLVILQTCAYHV